MSELQTPYECDGTCGDTYENPEETLLTVPTDPVRFVCGDCAERHFGITSDD